MTNLSSEALQALPFLYRCTRCQVRDEISRTCLCRDGGQWVVTDAYRASPAGNAQRAADHKRAVANRLKRTTFPPSIPCTMVVQPLFFW